MSHQEKSSSFNSAFPSHNPYRSSKIYYIIVALILLNTISEGQGIPASLTLQNETLTPTTSQSANDLKEYIIYSFVDGASPDSENDRIRLHLGMILATTEVKEYGGKYTGVEFWHVVMSDMQLRAFTSAIPRVSAIATTKTYSCASAYKSRGVGIRERSILVS